MLTAITSTQFDKDFKRIVQNPKFKQSEYLTVMTLLMSNQPLPAKYSNHPLIGNYDGYWDCHITNDCVLIYKIINNELRIARIGTHSSVFNS